MTANHVPVRRMGRANFAGPTNEIPRVAGLHYDYVVKQLRAFKAKERTNDAGNMTAVRRR